jgi:MFS family permease
VSPRLPDVPPVVWALAAGRFVLSTTSFLFLFLTLYLTGPRDLAATWAGLIAGASGVGLLLGNFTGGRWGDRFGHRNTLLVCSTSAGIGTALVPVLPTVLLAAWLPMISYLTATAGTSTGALTALAVPRGDRRTAVAIGRAASNAGFVIGPPLGALLVAWSYDAMFVVEGASVLLTRAVLARALPRSVPVEAHDGPGLWPTLRADRALVVLLCGVVLVDLVYRQLYTTLPLYLRDEGASVALYTGVIALGSGLILLWEIPVAVRLRRHAAYPIIAGGYALVGVGMAMFALPVSVLSAAAAMTVLTAGEILYKTTATAHVLDAAPDHLVGQYQGLYTGAATSGMMLSAPVGTAVYAAAPELLWPLCLVVAVVAAACVMVSGRIPAGTPTGSP